MIRMLQIVVRIFAKGIFLSLVLLVVGSLIDRQFPDLIARWSPLETTYASLALSVGVLLYLLNLSAVSRTLRRVMDVRKICVLTITMICVYLAAIYAVNLPYESGSHQLIWGYTGFTLYIVLFLRLVATVIAPIKAETREAVLVSDQPTHPTNVLTKTQYTVYRTLREIMSYDMPISVALTGAWGVGKTKILSQLERKSSGTVWFKFYPWAYTTEESLVEDFYVQLLRTINDSYPTFRLSNKTIIPNVKRIIDSAAGKGMLSTLSSIILEWFNDGKAPDQKISELLKAENIKVVVVIDDVERINSPKLINRTLQLAHYVKKMYGAKLIMSFERDVVINALPAHVKNGDEYLEKFFEVELKLHTPFQSDIESQLLSYIPMSLQPTYISKPLLQDIGSHRAIIRLANEYKMIDISASGGSLAGVIHPDDLLIMLHIKLKYPVLYSDIHDHPSIYTQPNGDANEESIDYYMESEDDRAKRVQEYITDLLLSIPQKRRETAKEHLLSLFPSLSKPLTGFANRSTNLDTLRKERRIGLRMVLDGYFSASNRLDLIIAHEKRTHQLIEALYQSHTFEDVVKETDSFLLYCNAIQGEGWDAPLYVLLNEVEDAQLDNDALFDISRALMISGLKLGAVYDSHRKVRILGQAFYIFVNRLLYKVPDDEKRRMVERMKFVDLLKYSATPLGSLLLTKMDLNGEAEQVTALLPDTVREELRLMTRRHHERYYVELGSDIVAETDEGYRGYIEKGWRDVIGNYHRGMATYREWLRSMQIKYPSTYLEPYVMKTHRGNWGFREKDMGTSTVVKDISQHRLIELVELIKIIYASPNLTAEDSAAIAMVQAYVAKNPKQVDRI